MEMTIRKTKWLIVGGYNRHKENISYFFKYVSRELGKYLLSMKICCYWLTVAEKEMKDIHERYGLENLIKVPTCYKKQNYKHMDLTNVR